jgi:hypothetical protein
MISNKGGRADIDFYSFHNNWACNFLVFNLYNQPWVDMKNDVKPTQATHNRLRKLCKSTNKARSVSGE